MKSMPFFGKIKGGIFQWKSKECFSGYCKLQKDGDYTLTLCKSVASKTNEQLGYFHAVVVPVVFKQMIDDGNDSIVICIKAKAEGQPHKYKEIPMTEDVVINMLKQIWATNKGCEVKSKADMSVEECSELIDVSIRWAEQYLGCQIPPPEKTLY
jgi:hypothetical protein